MSLTYKNKPHPIQDNNPTYLSRGKGLIEKNRIPKLHIKKF